MAGVRGSPKVARALSGERVRGLHIIYGQAHLIRRGEEG